MSTRNTNPIVEFKELVRLYDVPRDTVSPPLVTMALSKERQQRKYWGVDTIGRVFVNLPVRVEYGELYRQRISRGADAAGVAPLPNESALLVYQQHPNRDDIFTVASELEFVTNRTLLGMSRCNLSNLEHILATIPGYFYGVKYSDRGEAQDDARFWLSVTLKR